VDFFLDSGIIYGTLDDQKDWHRRRVKTFFRNFDFKNHNFTTTKRVATEDFQNVRRKRTEGITTLEREYQRAWAEILKLINDVDYFEHHLFDYLLKNVLEILERNKLNGNPKDRDADLLTNAYLWVYDKNDLNLPQFVTIDGNDIIRNRHEIKNKANECLSCNSELQMTPI
jgi:DNA-binding ferritin-like protein (Dps family)